MSRETPVRQIGIFAKYWLPGAVKTRLAARIGPVAAAEVAHAFVSCLVERLSVFPCLKMLGYSPPERHAAFVQLAPNWTHRPQCPGDLGARMADYFDDGFARADQVLLLGADCPTLPLSHVESAFAALADHQVAIGPAHDGGYCLIAARGQTPALFDHGQWGDDSVLERTMELARRRGITVALLPPWSDVDEFEDLQELQRQLQQEDGAVWIRLKSIIQNILDQTS